MVFVGFSALAGSNEDVLGRGCYGDVSVICGEGEEGS